MWGDLLLAYLWFLSRKVKKKIERNNVEKHAVICDGKSVEVKQNIEWEFGDASQSQEKKIHNYLRRNFAYWYPPVSLHNLS
jgi:hypothetical protein